jgi:ribonucleotide reductase alpha subunit
MMIASEGSVRMIKEIPPMYKNIYKTIWEIKQVWVLKNARARAPFVDQTQSMNIFMGVPDYKKLNSCHNWAWKNGLKTGMYYLRTRAAKSAIKFTVDPKLLNQMKEEECYSCSA